MISRNLKSNSRRGTGDVLFGLMTSCNTVKVHFPDYTDFHGILHNGKSLSHELTVFVGGARWLPSSSNVIDG